MNNLVGYESDSDGSDRSSPSSSKSRSPSQLAESSMNPSPMVDSNDVVESSSPRRLDNSQSSTPIPENSPASLQATPAQPQSPTVAQSPNPEAAASPSAPQTFVELPPSPPGPCNPEIEARFFRLFQMKWSNNLNMNDQILRRKEFKNPSIYDKLKDDFGVDEYGSNFDREALGLIPLDESDLYDNLLEEQSLLTKHEEKKLAAASSSRK